MVAASNGHNTVVLRSTNPISMAVVTSSSAGDLRNVTSSANAQRYPAIATDGSTWEEQVGSACPTDPPNCPAPTYAIRGARLSAALTPIDTKPITISENYTLSGSLRLASDGHDFLAAWSSSGAVHARGVAASGEVLEDQPLFAGTVQDLIWDGAQYDLAFAADRPDLAVAHLHPSGQAFETFLISATTDDKRSPSLVSLGNGRVVAAYVRLGHGSLYGGVPRAFVTTPRPARGRAAR